MKKGIAVFMAAVCAGSMTASADMLVAGWDAFNSGTAPTSTVFAAGITATAAGNLSNGGSEDRGASSDATWGSFDGNGVAASTSIVGTGSNLTIISGAAGTLTLTIVNNGTEDLDLANFHMDALAFRPKASRTFALSVLAGSDITEGNVFTSESQIITSLGILPNAEQDQHDEFDIDLSGLADSTLQVGGTAIFELAFTGGTAGSAGHHLWLDNIGVSAVPEPATLGLVAVFGGAVLFIRRRFMI